MKVYVRTISELSSSSSEFQSWHEEWDSSVTEVSLTRKSQSEAISIDADVKEGDIIYVLFMEYSTGDSFGHSDGNLEVIFAFKDYDYLIAAEIGVRSYTNESTDPKHFDILVDGNHVIQIPNPAYDYFTHIQYIESKSFVVTA